ncbi:hypothetical protein WMF20_32065 [Sorangium sp. So ce834]|uniref:hypothetical protein n=1 Tax=Sorangium sp. So ce834 TaxID=3133321 RepID=UPI003F625AB3
MPDSAAAREVERQGAGTRTRAPRASATRSTWPIGDRSGKATWKCVLDPMCVKTPRWRFEAAATP